MKPKGAASVNVNFVALREGLVNLSNLQIVDRETNRVYHTKDACEIFVLSDGNDVENANTSR